MSSVKIEISGFIRTDPAEKATAKGTMVLEFSIPHENRKEETEWYSCSLYGKQAEAMSWIEKGMGVHVRGTLIVNAGVEGKIYRNVSVDPYGIDVLTSNKQEEVIPF